MLFIILLLLQPYIFKFLVFIYEIIHYFMIFINFSFPLFEKQKINITYFFTYQITNILVCYLLFCSFYNHIYVNFLGFIYKIIHYFMIFINFSFTLFKKQKINIIYLFSYQITNILVCYLLFCSFYNSIYLIFQFSYMKLYIILLFL